MLTIAASVNCIFFSRSLFVNGYVGINSSLVPDLGRVCRVFGVKLKKSSCCSAKMDVEQIPKLQRSNAHNINIKTKQ